MNNKDRKRLMRLHSLMSQVPFPKMGIGTASATIGGFVCYANDIKTIQYAYLKVLFGMMTEYRASDPNGQWDVGWDYDDPDLMLDAIEAWVKMRNEQKWEMSDQHSFVPFLREAEKKMRKQDE